MNSWTDCVPGTSAERRSATRHGEHHRNARRLYAGHRDADAPPRRRLVAAARRGAPIHSCFLRSSTLLPIFKLLKRSGAHPIASSFLHLIRYITFYRIV